MWKGGHRQYNHDVFGAIRKGYEKGETDGMCAAIVHLTADTIKDNLNKQFGIYGADMLESICSFSMRRKGANV